MHFWKSITYILLLALLGIPALTITSTFAQPDSMCFPETGQCMSGRFREFWEQHGGLPVFGYPITPAQYEYHRETDQTYLTQWFERSRFELHPENRAPYDVLLGRLGDDRLRTFGRDWQREVRDEVIFSRCLWFTQTGYNVCDQSYQPVTLGFKQYWQTHGLEFDGRPGVSYAESLALFGLPLTAERRATSASGEPLLTQWFERARFEWHPSNPDQYKVQLGLLGAELQPEIKMLMSTYYFQDNLLFELSADGSTRREAAVSDLGRVLDVTQTGSSLLALREQGIQRIFVPNGPRYTITRFDQPAQYGQLVPDTVAEQILYGLGRDDPDVWLYEHWAEIGVIDSNTETSRSLALIPRRVSVLGFTPDRRGIYIVLRGMDPGISVGVVDVQTGALYEHRVAGGMHDAALSPTGRSLVTIAWRAGPADHELQFYDLTQPDKAPNVVVAPEPPSQVQSFHWSPMTSRLYATVFASQPDGSMASPGSLWQMNTRPGTWSVLAEGIPVYTEIGRVTHDGRWLTLRTHEASDAVMYVELASGRIVRKPIPNNVIVAR